MLRPVLLSAMAASALGAQPPSYSADIAPLLDRRCGACHSGQARMGEFAVDSFAMLMRGGNHGTPVIPGKPEESLLVQFVTGKAYPKMPMDGTTLSDGEIRLIEDWIRAGGKGPAEAEAATSRGAARAAAELKPRKVARPRIFAGAWQPGGPLLALGGHKKVTLRDAAAGKDVATLDGHQDAIRAVAFSPDGRLVAAAGGPCAKAGEAKIWDAASRRLVAAITGHADCIYGLAFSPDGKMLATSSYDKLIKLWDAATGAEIRTLKDHIDAVYAVAFTAGGRRLVSGSADRGVKVWDPATGRRLYTLSDATDGINTVAVDPTGQLVAAGGLDKSIRIWRMGESGGELLHTQMAHEDAILKLAWSPDGQVLASSSADRSVKLFRASDLTELRSIPGTDWAYALEFSPDGKRLAVGRLDGSLAVYER